MELSLLKRKKPVLDDKEDGLPYPPYSKRVLSCPTDVLKGNQVYRTSEAKRKESRIWHCINPSPHHPSAFVEGVKDLRDTKGLLGQISFWADTQRSVNKVLEHLELGRGVGDTTLEHATNERFLEFHRDITGECGAEDRQHSWAVIEKQQEVLMYGPYYPNYHSGEHSEDVVVRQTEELLELKSSSEEWSVYVFTQNSPCLARNTWPCMLHLVQKAHEWHMIYGVRTHIGYVKCWGFKGHKENLFRDIDYRQLDLVDLSEDHGCYLRAAQKGGLTPLCENLYSAIKQLFKLGLLNVKFPLINSVQDWKICFKRMEDILETEPQDRRDILTPVISSMTEAVEELLSKEEDLFEEHLERGEKMVLKYNFNSQTSYDPVYTQMRQAFVLCWTDVVRNRYAEFIRERLTEDFNRCSTWLFSKDIARVCKEYVQIGRIRFSAEHSKLL